MYKIYCLKVLGEIPEFCYVFNSPRRRRKVVWGIKCISLRIFYLLYKFFFFHCALYHRPSGSDTLHFNNNNRNPKRYWVGFWEFPWRQVLWNKFFFSSFLNAFVNLKLDHGAPKRVWIASSDYFFFNFL